jgi:hypothetical protein
MDILIVYKWPEDIFPDFTVDPARALTERSHGDEHDDHATGFPAAARAVLWRCRWCISAGCTAE